MFKDESSTSLHFHVYLTSKCIYGTSGAPEPFSVTHSPKLGCKPLASFFTKCPISLYLLPMYSSGSHLSIYFILFYFILFYFILFYFTLFYFILFYFILFYLFIYLFSWTIPNLKWMVVEIIPCSCCCRQWCSHWGSRVFQKIGKSGKTGRRLEKKRENFASPER